MFKKYEIIVEHGTNLERVYLVAKNQKQAASKVEGEIVRIKEVPNILPSAERVAEDLKRAGYGEAEVALVRCILSHVEGCDEPAWPA